MNHIKHKEVVSPAYESIPYTILSDATMEERKNNIISRMKAENLDVLVIYADVEHSFNFEYLCGFIPRFEEAALVLHANGESYLMLGNEVMGIGKFSRLPSTLLLTQHFSLPNQPMDAYEPLHKMFEHAKIHSGLNKVGVVGWKNLYQISSHCFELPHYVIEALRTFDVDLVNATNVFIDPMDGVRNINNVDEIRHYEYGQVLAANNMLKAMNAVAVGKTEVEMASMLESEGQKNNIVTIFATGTRFEKANVFPTTKKLTLGDKISMSVGYKGGLSSRAAYLVENKEQLPMEVKEYLNDLVIPYFNAITQWLKTIHVGMNGSDLYDFVEEILPKATYNWSLNPGHLCADEEWLNSPVYQGSKCNLKSGMLLQVDIIPGIAPYAGSSCENGILLADATLRETIQNEDKVMYDRFMARRAFIEEQLGVELHADVMPLSNMVAYMRPYLLNKTHAMCIEKN